MIRLDDVWKSYDGRPVLRGVTLHVHQAEGVILTGPSGAGKTTLLRLIYLAEDPDHGTIRVAERELGRLRRSSIPYVRRNIGVVFQDFKLIHGATVRQNVSVVLEALGMPRREIALRTDAAIAAVGLEAEADLRVQSLPGGAQQRVAVARALCADPPILLCDEPTGNLDPQRAHDLLELLEGIRGRGTTLLVATHDPAVVAFGLSHGWRKAELHGGQVLSPTSPAPDRLPRSDLDAAPRRAVSTERSLDLRIEIDLGEEGYP